MQLLLSVLCALVATSCASVIPATPTYALTPLSPGIVTAHSDQVFIRNHNRLYVPTVTATRTLPLPVATYPATYTYTTNAYPQIYGYRCNPYAAYPYGGYAYNYAYGYTYVRSLC